MDCSSRSPAGQQDGTCWRLQAQAHRCLPTSTHLRQPLHRRPTGRWPHASRHANPALPASCTWCPSLAEMAVTMYVQGLADLGIWAAIKAIPLALALAAAAKFVVDRRLQTRCVAAAGCLLVGIVGCGPSATDQVWGCCWLRCGEQCAIRQQECGVCTPLLASNALPVQCNARLHSRQTWQQRPPAGNCLHGLPAASPKQRSKAALRGSSPRLRCPCPPPTHAAGAGRRWPSQLSAWCCWRSAVSSLPGPSPRPWTQCLLVCARWVLPCCLFGFHLVWLWMLQARLHRGLLQHLSWLGVEAMLWPCCMLRIAAAAAAACHSPTPTRHHHAAPCRSVLRLCAPLVCLLT